MMNIRPAYLIKTIVILSFFQNSIFCQNVGIGTLAPTSKLHLNSTVQNYSALALDFETGTVDDENTSGDYDWYITETDGFASTKSVKMPLILAANETATLSYGFDMVVGKEVTVTFDIKYDDPSNLVTFKISSNHFSYTPTSSSFWTPVTQTFICQSTSDVIYFAAKANQNEAFPIVHIDNINITYEDGHVLKIEDGSEGEGKFLQSDALGQTEWYDLRGEINQNISDNYQNLSFNTTSNELKIENANSISISGLKNGNDQVFRLSDTEILSTDGLALRISGENTSTLLFDPEGHTMDWGIENDSIKGIFSTRWGGGTVASGTYSTAWGESNRAINSFSTSWGQNNVSSGLRGTSWGLSNEASGINSSAFGENNKAIEDNSMTWGQANLSSASQSTSWGFGNTASGSSSTAFGAFNSVLGSTGCSWGAFNLSSGWRSTTWGKDNEATEENSTSFGLDNISSGELATSWGESNEASHKLSSAWGYNNNTSGYSGTIWGQGNISSSSYSTVWGRSNTVHGSLSTSWGDQNLISHTADNATAFGYSNDLEGELSLAAGYRNNTYTYLETAFGRYNDSFSGSNDSWEADEMLFSIGNGESSTSRNNALSILKNGNIALGNIIPSYNLHLDNNSAAKPGSSSWTVSSDRRLKKDIQPFEGGLEIISAIEPVWFTYNGQAQIPESTHIGTIAQDLEAIAPYMVTEYTHRDKTGKTEEYKAVDYGAMDFLLVNAIKEQQAMILSQQEKIDAQQKQIDELILLVKGRRK